MSLNRGSWFPSSASPIVIVLVVVLVLDLIASAKAGAFAHAPPFTGMRRRTRRSASAIRVGTPDMTIGPPDADQAGERALPAPGGSVLSFRLLTTVTHEPINTSPLVGDASVPEKPAQV